MADKFINLTGGITAIKAWVLGLLGNKQDSLVSGTNIKTVNNESLLGSGNIDLEDIFIATSNTTTYNELVQAIDNNKIIIINKMNHKLLASSARYNAQTAFLNVAYPNGSDIACLEVYTIAKTDNSWTSSIEYLNVIATENQYGGVKLNPSESVTLNSNGQLDVGGRLGAFSGTTGIFHAKDRQPRSVGDFSFLITDAMGMNLAAPRDFALVTGVNLSLTKSHAAGSTTYTVANNYANRIACAVLYNGGNYGYVSQNEAYSKANQIVKVTSVKINGQNYTPDSSVNDSSKPITITTEATANPTAAVTALRVFGSINGGYCSEYIGQCVGGSVGASLVIGQRVYSSANVNCIVAADVYNTGNGNAIFGRQHISRKNRGLLAGTGHDTTNARSESVSALGAWSDITSETVFAIGDGTSHIDRSNAFEVRDQAFVVKSPNGTKWKVTVDNNGNLTTTAV